MGLIATQLLSTLWGALARVPLWVWVVGALLVWGWHGRQQLAAEQRAKQNAALQASEDARETERLAAKANQKVTDELLNATRARAAAARSSAERLRQLALARTESAALQAALSECRSYAGPAVHVIPDAVREELGRLFDEADDTADRLRACQAYVREVVRPDGS